MTASKHSQDGKYLILQFSLKNQRCQAHKHMLLEDYFKTSSYFVGVQEVYI
jgi:hypothetical protein